ncbi:VOC family protein [Kordiimonas lipolytica]|uniref:VOC family protein n=1 Tax=Kordiimonas lipolytica TaxID=1662421 RepID=A0ABV8UEA2_9PROT|nr:VOC family protein [Kordiimonas lipolytica]
MIESATAVLPVDRIEPSIDFFARVGFEKVVEVPEGDHLGFAILMQGGVQLMYQTRTSIFEDSGMLPNPNEGTPVLMFLKTDDLEGCKKALEGYEVVMKERTTFYGAREIGYREPGGHIVTFAEFAEEAEG